MSCATGMALWLSMVATATAHTSASDSPAVTTFTSWCADVGIGLNHVEWHDEASATALTNRQTVATAPISKGDPVISIPLSAVLNVEHALSDPVVGAIWDTKEGAELSELDILAAFLVYELYKPSDSRWQQYLDFLPRTYPSNPLYYTEEELVQLKGLCVEPFVLRRRHQVNTSFTLVERVVTAGDPNGRHFKPGMLTADRFRWASATVRSRSHLISLKDGDGKWQKAMCLVPAADMLNMAVDTADANLECKTDTAAGLSLSQQRFLCTATRDIPAGTELMTVYAGSSMRRADGRLLLEYGFVPESNPSFAVDVLPPSSEVTGMSSIATAALELLPEALVMDPLGWSTDPAMFAATFLFYFRAATLSEEAINGRSAGDLATALAGQEPLSSAHERVALAAARDYLTAAHAQINIDDFDGVLTGCSEASVSAVQRLRAKELASIDGTKLHVDTYESELK